jgi:glycosyltransferase involved in cell wall biosynthesis
MESVVAFTDTYLPTVNGVTYTVKTWRECWEERGGRMDVVYPNADGHDPDDGEYPVASLPFPFYDGFRFGVPRVPDAVADADVVHAHTPFGLGLSALRLARRDDRPVVANYHTPTGEYASYLTLTSWAPLEPVYARLSERYERWYFSRADAVVVPSEQARDYLLEEVGVARRGPATEVHVVPNGVDIDRFAPADDEAEAFRDRYDLGDGPLIGYTGRHGFEKNLGDVFAAAEGLDDADARRGRGGRETSATASASGAATDTGSGPDPEPGSGRPPGTGRDAASSAPGSRSAEGVTVVFGGDGPAREGLERRAADCDVETRFLGFLDREELPAFYSALDAFAFPSPVETQGLVALEATACGTPVVAVDAGALSDTVQDGRNGYHYQPGDLADFRDGIRRALAERDALTEQCLAMREEISVEHAVDRLEDVYESVV